MKKIVKNKRCKYLYVKVLKTTKNYEVVLSGVEYPYWKKTLRTQDEMVVEETYLRYRLHAFLLQWLPPRLCYNLVHTFN